MERAPISQACLCVSRNDREAWHCSPATRISNLLESGFELDGVGYVDFALGESIDGLRSGAAHYLVCFEGECADVWHRCLISAAMGECSCGHF